MKILYIKIRHTFRAKKKFKLANLHLAVLYKYIIGFKKRFIIEPNRHVLVLIQWLLGQLDM